MPAKKQNFRDEVRDFTKRSTGVSFDSLNDFQRSQWMTRTYLEMILKIMNPGTIPDDIEDFEAAFTDGPSDAGVDFLNRSDGHVLIVQAKYHRHGKDEREQDFEYFCNVLSRLHPSIGHKYKINNRVKELASEIDWEHDTFDLHYITLSRVGDNIRAREKIGQQSIDKISGIAERVEINCYSETDLNQLLREAATASEQIIQPIDIQFDVQDGEPPWIIYEGIDGRASYIGCVKAAQLRNLYTKHKYRLFAQNIRNYVGDTSTNKGIIETALEKPHSFFFFNNGVSAIATEIVPNAEAGILQCRRFSVINGAQTVRSLAKAHIKSPQRAGEAAVLVRISEVSLKHNETEEAFLENITRYNNTQNAIKVSDFRSNDPVQRALAKKFATLYRGGKQYWYKNKRSGDRDPRKLQISMEEFAKTIFSFRFGPPDMFGGTSHLFDTTQAGGYLKLFGTEGELWSAVTDEQFCSLAGVWFICEKVRELLKDEKNGLIDNAGEEEEIALVRHALERRWLLYYTVGEIIRRKYKNEKDELESDIARLSKPKWLDEKSGIAREIKRYTHLACEVQIKVYRSASRSPSFVHRNWYRTQETLKDISREIQYSTTILDTLNYLKGSPS